jgi:uncharacterized membrane protein YeaQ/YmgE (transglycosylase-associated protein family)
MIIIYWIIFGAIVGWLASIITHNNHRQGLLLDIGVGLIGSVIGGWLASIIGGSGINTFTLLGFIFSIVGAVLFIVVVKYLRRRF